MSFPISFQTLKALPPLCSPQQKHPSPSIITSNHKLSCNSKANRLSTASNSLDSTNCSEHQKSDLAFQLGTLLATVAEPAYAVTGVNNEQDLNSVLIQSGIVAFWYFILMPPIIMNWLRIRWYRRKLLEMYLQFMFVFIFCPGLLLWAPFLNFRKFPRDPSLKYPWSKPENPSQVKGGFLKYPWASLEDYE
ncbi:hypothetical protein Ancab_021188 [Ancistrocladus abbreviatus]